MDGESELRVPLCQRHGFIYSTRALPCGHHLLLQGFLAFVILWLDGAGTETKAEKLRREGRMLVG